MTSNNYPDAPIGTRQRRITLALHWHWTSEFTNKEIAKRLGVSEETVSRYLHSEPAEEVRNQMNGVEADVRLIAVKELKSQLQAAGHEAKTAEKPVKVWQNDEGNLIVKDKIDEQTGEITGKYPVPHDIELGPDRKARYFRRAEVREILELLCEITGAKEPEELRIDQQTEVSGGFEVNITHHRVTDDESE